MVTNTGCSTFQSSLVKDFENGIHLGIGGFNLVLSLLPPIIVKLLEWVGFSGDRFLGLKHLHKGSKGQSLRSPLCSLLLLAYHTWISQYLGNGDGDMEYSEQALLPLLTAYPKGSIFIFFDGRIKQVRGRLDEAISRYKHSITLQSEIKQFHHIFYWELMWCLAYKGDWVQASHYAGVLLDESLWSKTVYMHLNASFIFMARLVNQPITSQQDEVEKDLFKRLPGYKRRIGGQCLPFEDFAIHKANKYFKQNGRLFLPGVELIYLWNGFKVLGHRPDLVEPLMNLVDNSLHILPKAKDDYGSYLDDWCLGKLLQAMCCRCLNRKRKAMEYLKGALSRSKDLTNDSYLAPYTCAEIGFLYLEEGDLELAREHLERARKHQDHLLQSLLHLRIHAALQKIENYSIQNELFGVGGEFAHPNQAFVIKEDLEESGNESEFFDAEEDWDDSRPRQDSNSSFDIISDDELDTIIS